jgi:hypothetical protein
VKKYQSLNSLLRCLYYVMHHIFRMSMNIQSEYQDYTWKKKCIYDTFNILPPYVSCWFAVHKYQHFTFLHSITQILLRGGEPHISHTFAFIYH